MRLSVTVKSVAFDLLAGVVAFGCLLAWVVLSGKNDLQLFTLVTGAVFFLAGMLRAAPGSKNVFLAAALISLGGMVPLVILRVTVSAFTEYGYVPLFIAFSLSMAAVGIGLRHLLARGRIPSASALAGVSFGGAALTITWVIPLLITRWASTAIDLPARSFSIMTFTGRTVSSADLKGHVVVLAFWATWCAPCRQELPELQQAYERYKGSRNVTFYAVDGPWGGDDIAKASAFASRINVALPLAFDPRGAAKALGVQGFPAVVVLDGRGRIRLFHDGYDASEGLAREVVTEVRALQGSRT